MKTNREIRAAARASLGGGPFTTLWITALLVTLVYSILTNILSSFPFGFLLSLPMILGLRSIFLSLLRGADRIDLADLFYAFRGERFLRALGLALLQTLYLLLWAILLVVPAIVKSYSYRLAYYVALDNPELTANDCITMSRRLMEGYKWKAFLLDLSFLGWILLGLLTCGIGYLFVAPYMNAAHASFYHSLMEQKDNWQVGK